LTRGDLESLAGLIAQRRKKAEDLYDTLLDETELYELKEDINLFLGNKNYWGGDISSSGINDYNNTKYSRYKKLSDNEATEIERWKRAIGTAEFKRERCPLDSGLQDRRTGGPECRNQPPLHGLG
jgi:hypothetical protein